MTTDLDALAVLLEAATPGPWIGTRWLHEYGYGYFHTLRPDQRQGITTNDALLIDAAVNALPSLIEAARREAALRKVLDGLLAVTFRGEDFLTQNGVPMEATPGVRRALRNVRALLHASTGTATGDEVGEP